MLVKHAALICAGLIFNFHFYIINDGVSPGFVLDPIVFFSFFNEFPFLEYSFKILHLMESSPRLWSSFTFKGHINDAKICGLEICTSKSSKTKLELGQNVKRDSPKPEIATSIKLQ